MSGPSATGNSKSSSYWIETSPTTSYASLASDDKADVAIVGGGIAGLTAAYLLARAGKSVILLERNRIAMAETGHTTAHLQVVDDTRLAELVERFGVDGAQKVWEGHLEALHTIESIVARHHISCEFKRLDAYLWTADRAERARMIEDMKLARQIGFAAEPASVDDVPFKAEHVVRYPEQGKFHVRKYLVALAQEATKLGARIHERTEVSDIHSGRAVELETRAGFKVKADWLLSCTNVPFIGRETVIAKLEAFRTYAIGARVPRGIFRDALYWDTADPYHYTRVEPQGAHDLVIHGGEDHPVGDTSDTESKWASLLAHLREVTDEAEPSYHWSGEVLETADGLPYIGEIPGRGANELMVTGDSGTGMTNGTTGALILTERVLGRGTPWDDLYAPSRLEADMHVGKELLKYNAHAVKRFVKGVLEPSELDDIAQLEPGQGAIMKHHLKPVAVSRLDDGTLCAVSGVCTHVGCTVAWNHGEQSWDCPCHGSRFSPRGDVLHGPANDALPTVDVADLLKKHEEAH